MKMLTLTDRGHMLFLTVHLPLYCSDQKCRRCRSYFSPCLISKLSRKRCCLRDLSCTSFQKYYMKSGIFLAQRKESKTPTLMTRSHFRIWGVSGLQHPCTADTLGNVHFQFDSTWSKGCRLLWWFGFFLLPVWVLCGLGVVQPSHIGRRWWLY